MEKIQNILKVFVSAKERGGRFGSDHINQDLLFFPLLLIYLAQENLEH